MLGSPANSASSAVSRSSVSDNRRQVAYDEAIATRDKLASELANSIPRLLLS